MKLPKFTRNFYFLTGLLFIVWMLFIDSNDFISQYRLSRTVKDLEERKEYYQKNIEELSQQFEQRQNDPDYIEKFAREKYFMKKEGEDLYVVVEK